MKTYTITKKIAKQGNQAVILIPKLLRDELRPSTVVKLTIDVLREAN
jgi:antitoxin component of MazEF toxin-antitoxin module